MANDDLVLYQHKLWSMALAGDNKARNDLFESLMPLVNSVCGRLSRTYGANWREEFMQQAFLAHCRAIDSFKPDLGVDYGSYLCYKVEQAAKQTRRRQHRGFSLRKHVAPTRDIESLVMKSLYGRENMGGMKQVGRLGEVTVEFKELLDKIGNEKLREMIVLRFVEDRSLREIAELWGVSTVWVHKLEKAAISEYNKLLK